MTAVVLPLYALSTCKVLRDESYLRFTIKEKMYTDKQQKPYQSTQWDCSSFHKATLPPTEFKSATSPEEKWMRMDRPAVSSQGSRFMFLLCAHVYMDCKEEVNMISKHCLLFHEVKRTAFDLWPRGGRLQKSSANGRWETRLVASAFALVQF